MRLRNIASINNVIVNEGKLTAERVSQHHNLMIKSTLLKVK